MLPTIFDPVELRRLMATVPAAHRELLTTAIGRVEVELTDEVPSARLVELADTLDVIGMVFDRGRRELGGVPYCPFAELADDLRHAA